MSTISSEIPESSTSRTESRRLAATALSFCSLGLLTTLHILAVFNTQDMQKSPGDTTVFFYCVYGVAMMVGGFLSDHFKSRILFLVTFGLSGLFTTIFPLTSGTLRDYLLVFMVSFDGIAWLAAAKLIKNVHAIPQSQQQLWWALLAACTSTNICTVILSLQLSMLQTIGSFYAHYVVGLSTLLLLIPIAASYKRQRSEKNEVSKISVKRDHKWYWESMKSLNNNYFWNIAILNTVLWNAKWFIAIIIQEEQEPLRVKGTLIDNY